MRYHLPALLLVALAACSPKTDEPRETPPKLETPKATGPAEGRKATGPDPTKVEGLFERYDKLLAFRAETLSIVNGVRRDNDASRDRAREQFQKAANRYTAATEGKLVRWPVRIHGVSKVGGRYAVSLASADDALVHLVSGRHPRFAAAVEPKELLDRRKNSPHEDAGIQIDCSTSFGASEVENLAPGDLWLMQARCKAVRVEPLTLLAILPNITIVFDDAKFVAKSDAEALESAPKPKGK